MKQFIVLYSEWYNILPSFSGTKEEAILAGRVTSPYRCFGPASREECEKYTAAYNHYRAVWRLEEVV